MLLGDKTGAETDFGAEADSGVASCGQWVNSFPMGCKVRVCPGYQLPCSSGSSQSTAAPNQCDYQRKHLTLKGKFEINFCKLTHFSKIQHVLSASSDVLNETYLL